MLKRNIYKIPGPNLSEDNRGRNQMFPEWPNYFNIDIIRHLTKKIVLEKATVLGLDNFRRLHTRPLAVTHTMKPY